MSKKKKVDIIRFGRGDYESGSVYEELLSLKLMRGVFLQEAVRLIPDVLEDLSNSLLGLYQRIPLFCYEGDKKRRRKQNETERVYTARREDWYVFNRPKWHHIEAAWKDRNPQIPFEIRFDSYHGKMDRSRTVFLTPLGSSPPHKDLNISAFTEKLFAWSCTYHLDAEWCREHAYETLEQ